MACKKVATSFLHGRARCDSVDQRGDVRGTANLAAGSKIQELEQRSVRTDYFHEQLWGLGPHSMIDVGWE